MNPADLSAISALLGALIGGLTSFLTSWVTLTLQARQARLAAERSKREDLYGAYMTELAILFGDALTSTSVDFAKLTKAFALKGRITLIASPPVLASADDALKFVVDLFLGPPRAPAEVRAMMDDRNVDPIGTFARVCREEMRTRGLG
jgi:hypothetical protein